MLSSLSFDTGDEEIDKMLEGLTNVIIGYREELIIEIE